MLQSLSAPYHFSFLQVNRNGHSDHAFEHGGNS